MSTPIPSSSASASTRADAGDWAPTVEQLLAVAVVCRALKLAFDQPGVELHQTLFTADGQNTLRRAARQLAGKEPSDLSRRLEMLASRRSPGVTRLRRAYERIFGHTLRGRVCPYECEYGKPGVFRQAQELADLGGFYAAFGLRTRQAKHQRHDHVACELEFLQFLAHKQVWALEQGDAEMQKVCHDASRRFLSEHLAHFGPAFAAGLRGADAEGIYGELGALLDAFLITLCERLGVSPGPGNLELQPQEPDSAPMACGSGNSLVQIGEASDG